MFFSHDDNGSFFIEGNSACSSCHLIHFDLGVLLVPFDRSSIGFGGFDDDQSGWKVDSHGESAGCAENFKFELEEKTLDCGTVLHGETGVVEGDSLTDHVSQILILDGFYGDG